MKKINIIYTTLFLYIVIATSIPFLADIYVDKKEHKEYVKALNKLNEFFKDQDKYIFIDYSGEKVGYEQISIPKYKKKPLLLSKGKDKLEWEEKWGDVYKLYKLKPRYTSENDLFADHTWTGWSFTAVEKFSHDGFCSYMIYPYQVAYKRQNERWMYDYMPSVQSAVDESFDFFTNNEKSSYKQYISSKNKGIVYDLKSAIAPEYDSYFIAFSYDEDKRILGKETLDSILYSKDINKMSNHNFVWSEIQPNETQDEGGMYTQDYKVNNRYQPVARWVINYNFWVDPKKKDRENIILYSEISWLALAFFIIFPLGVKEYRRRKFDQESLKNKLLRLCNPKQFMKPYNEKKISIANDIYEKILNSQESDIIVLKELRKEASIKLGIDFIDKNKKRLLLSEANPKRFMKPYNADKVRIANAICAQLSSESIDIDTLEDIEQEIKEKL